MGGPLAIEVENTEWPKWQVVMSADPVDPAALEGLARNAPLTRPRPGHADYTGMQKYGFAEARPALERASARETATRVALGTAAQQLLRELGITTVSHTVAVGAVSAPEGQPCPARLTWTTWMRTRSDASMQPPQKRWSPRSTLPIRRGDAGRRGRGHCRGPSARPGLIRPLGPCGWTLAWQAH